MNARMAEPLMPRPDEAGSENAAVRVGSVQMIHANVAPGHWHSVTALST